eukprot:gene23095-30290_t
MRPVSAARLRATAGTSPVMLHGPGPDAPPRSMKEHDNRSVKRRRRLFACQVAGCTFNLSTLKAYYQRHRICMEHFKMEFLEIDGKQASLLKLFLGSTGRAPSDSPDTTSGASSAPSDGVSYWKGGASEGGPEGVHKSAPQGSPSSESQAPSDGVSYWKEGALEGGPEGVCKSPLQGSPSSESQAPSEGVSYWKEGDIEGGPEGVRKSSPQDSPSSEVDDSEGEAAAGGDALMLLRHSAFQISEPQPRVPSHSALQITEPQL